MRKKRAFVKKFSEAMRFVAVMTLIVFVTQSGAVWAITATTPLSAVENPVLSDLVGTPGRVVVLGSGLSPANTLPANMHIPVQLAPYVKDMNAAIMLGKALFWDMQAGSDGIQACATCHHRGGVDPIKHAEDAASVRDTNEINPGADNSFLVPGANNAPLLANALLTPGDFNFTKGICVSGAPCLRVPAPVTPNAFTLTPGTTGFGAIVGSQGVIKTSFVNVVPGSRKDSGSAPLSPETTYLSASGAPARQVTGRNTPPTVNAVFNFDNFWDGRANHIFNGSSPIGPMDVNAKGAWVKGGGVTEPTLVQTPVAIPNASLASQAVGPPLSSVEMSFAGRTFPQLGRKMLSLTPLGIQRVSPNDSVLGPLSNSPNGKGLNVPANATTKDTGYKAMIENAFVDTLWNTGLDTPDGFTQMEANFSLFWGIAIMCYEATLVSDQTPFDAALALNGAAPVLNAAFTFPAGFVSGAGGPNAAPITANASAGFGAFKGNCDVCHSGAEMTTASVLNVINILNGAGVITAAGTATGPANLVNHTNAATLDTAFARTAGATETGFANIGVRSTNEDVGRGAASPNFPLPLSVAVQQATLPPAQQIFGTVPPAGVVSVAAAAATQVNASFKVPSLRNVELTGPFFHNGSVDRLGDVVDLYAAGGFFQNAELSTKVNGKIGVNKNDMVAFLLQLTDPRVKAETAPFDHPELIIPNGEPEFGHMIRIPAKDKNGGTEGTLPTVNPTVPATTNRGHPVISGTKEAGADVTISVNGGVAVAPDIATDTTFTATLNGLHSGNNAVTITANDIAGGVRTVIKNIVVAFPSGIITGGATVNVNDALRALKIGVGLETQTDADLANGDVAPVVGGLPEPDGQITVADAVVILRLAVGLEQF